MYGHYFVHFGFLFIGMTSMHKGMIRLGRNWNSPLPVLVERRKQERLVFSYSHTSQSFDSYLTKQIFLRTKSVRVPELDSLVKEKKKPRRMNTVRNQMILNTNQEI